MSRALVCLAALLAGCPAQQPDDGSDVGAIDMPADSADATTPRDLTEDPRDTSGDPPDLSSERPPVRSISSQCPMASNTGGSGWTGWGNLQHPPLLMMGVGEISEPVFGQTWQDGVTNQPGAASGWEAQLVVGPLGVNPVDQPDCFRAIDAEYNADVENNDEWWVRLHPDRAGLWGMYYRYRPADGAWRYGDLNGSDDGVSTDQAAILAVDDATKPADLRVVTLNLRCRTDQWDVRLPLVIEALVAADPHLVGFQEDCSIPGGPSQASEIRAALAERLDRGFDLRRTVTHQADYPDGTFDEGISLLSAFAITSDAVVDLPYTNFPRRALVADVRLSTIQLRFINTHFDNGGGNDDIRTQEAAALVAQLGAGPTVLAGDLNADPGDPAYDALDAALDDAWSAAGVGPGLTLPSDAPARRIDYIWTLGLTTISAETHNREAGGIHLSDHLALSATVAP